MMQETKWSSVGGTAALDIGSSNSAVAVWKNGAPIIVPSSSGATIYGKNIPSYVYYSAAQGVKVGVAAKDMQATEPANVAYEFKRWLGRDDPDTGKPKQWILDGKVFRATDLVGLMARYLVKQAQQFLEQRVDNLVLTAPAYFNDIQLNQLKMAVQSYVRAKGQGQSVKVLRVERQPTAAALAYDKKGQKDQVLIVMDIGGGTTDCSLLRMENKVHMVKGLGGDARLGGQDIDRILIDYALAQIKAHTGLTLSQKTTPVEYADVRDQTQKAKIRLSQLESTQVTYRNLGYDEVHKKPISYSMRLSRQMLEQLLSPLLPRFDACIDQAFSSAQDLKLSDVTGILLVGGPGHMHFIKNYLQKKFGKPILTGVNVTQSVALGAASLAASLVGQVSQESQICLINSTPMHLGIQVVGGRFEHVIQKGTHFPIEKTSTFSTSEDYQTTVEIKIFEGMRPRAADNVFLGSFRLDGIESKPKGHPHIEITFMIDSNGILSVTAKDRGSTKSQSLKVSREGKISDQVVHRMEQAARLHAQSDAEFTEISRLKDRLNHSRFSLETLLKQGVEYRITDQERTQVQGLKNQIEGMIQSGDRAKLSAAVKDIEERTSKLFAAIYVDSRKQPPGEASPQ